MIGASLLKIYVLNLHVALPIYVLCQLFEFPNPFFTWTFLRTWIRVYLVSNITFPGRYSAVDHIVKKRRNCRSEEHTSVLQSRENLVFRILLEKKTNERAYYSDT